MTKLSIIWKVSKFSSFFSFLFSLANSVLFANFATVVKFTAVKF